MADSRRRKSPTHFQVVHSVRVRIDAESKECLMQAARLRGITLGDFVRAVVVPQARREVHAAREQTLALTAEEQLAFWKALAEPSTLTEPQRRLGVIMRGDN